ncbi:MAG: hypothetical protein ACR2OX_00815, partial [Methyloligellaceae bacterium]
MARKTTSRSAPRSKTAAKSATKAKSKTRSKSKPAASTRAAQSTPRWAITGVSQQTRNAVRKAAEKEGVPVGTWVNKALRAAVKDGTKGGVSSSSMPPGIHAAMGEITQRLDRIEARVHEKMATAPNAADVNQIADEFRRKAGDVFDQMQKSTATVVDNVVEHTDSTVSPIRAMSSSTIERIKAAADAAMDG